MLETLRGVYPFLLLYDRVAIAPARDGEEVDQTDIGDMASVERMVEGVDGIIHLGGISGENTWENILHGNIVGLYNVFEAGRKAGVKRIIMATSNHAVGFYKREQVIDHTVMVRPRIAATAYRRRSARRSAASIPTSTASGSWGSASAISAQGKPGRQAAPLDLGQPARPDAQPRQDRAHEHPGIRYEIVYGVSDNKRSWYDNSERLPVGVQARGRNSEPQAAQVLSAELSGAHPVAEARQGGTFCADEYDAQRPRD